MPNRELKQIPNIFPSSSAGLNRAVSSTVLTLLTEKRVRHPFGTGGEFSDAICKAVSKILQPANRQAKRQKGGALQNKRRRPKKCNQNVVISHPVRKDRG